MSRLSEAEAVAGLLAASHLKSQWVKSQWALLDSSSVDENLDSIDLPSPLRQIVEASEGLASLQNDDGDIFCLQGRVAMEMRDAFPAALSIASSAEGSFWVLDLSAGLPVLRSPIWCVSHDPPIAVIVSLSLREFVEDMVQSGSLPRIPPSEPSRLYPDNPLAQTHSHALRSGDAELASFAAVVGAGYLYLRVPLEPGQGFVWATAGPETKIVRRDRSLLFATEVRLPTKKKSYLSRLKRWF